MDQFTRERELQDRVEQTLGAAMPHVELLDVQLDQAHGIARIFVDTPDGIDVEGCSLVAKAIRDTVPDQLALEVSSPGIERPLRHARHFANAVGSRIELRERGRTGTRTRTVTLEAVDGDQLTISSDGQQRVVALSDVARARLSIDFATYEFAAAKRRSAQ